jgi:hypothetical protein
MVPYPSLSAKKFNDCLDDFEPDAFIGFDSDTDDNIEVAQAYYKEFYGK